MLAGGGDLCLRGVQCGASSVVCAFMLQAAGQACRACGQTKVFPQKHCRAGGIQIL